MKKLLSFLVLVLIDLAVFAQSVTLTFTAKDAANQYVQLNRVAITNLTKGWQETIYWPDTTLTMQNGTGINDVETPRRASLQLLQNNPNPFTGTTEVNLTVAEEDEVMLDIMDINGKNIGTQRMRPQAGIQQFRITLSTAGTYVMTARQNGRTSSIKMVCNGGGDGNRIEYTGVVGTNNHSPLQTKNGPKYTINNPFDFGDQMEYVGYASINGTEVESEHITQSQNVSQIISLNFKQPCLGTPTVTDIDGNIYNTVQIVNQCWMKENLRTTHYADGTNIPLGTGASTITPYRYNPNNNASIVPTYGYLYNWAAVMHGASSSSANPSGVQGICPNGWHVPSDAEWTHLMYYVGSQTQFQCNDSSDYIAKAMASTTGWNGSIEICAVGNNPGSNNAAGFSAFPAGYYHGDGYGNFGYCAIFWSTREFSFVNDAFSYYLFYNHADVLMYQGNEINGFSVRCLRNATGSESLPTVTTNSVSSITTPSATCGGNVTSDGGAMVTDRGVCWSTSQNPTVSDSHTSNGIGTGSFTSIMTGLSPNTTYYVRAYATNNVGTAYGSQVSFTTFPSIDGQPCPYATMVTDIDNNTYNTVQIGNQCWMKENLRTTRFENGVIIPMGNMDSYTPYRYAPDEDSSNVSTYGYLYNWVAVMHGTSSSSANPSGVQGICPAGWHVPSDSEWNTLTNYVRSQTQYCCDNGGNNIAKALASTMGWNSSTSPCAVGNNASTNNATGFSALPAGNNYWNIGSRAFFWSATETGDYAYSRLFNSQTSSVSSNISNKFLALSVRCVRD